MTAPQQNLVPSEVDLNDTLNLFKKNLLLRFNCHHVAKVQSFNKVTQTASVTINYKKSFSLPNSMGVYSEKLVDYPILASCPVIFVGGGGGCLTFPVEQGDDCLVLFNDRDIDNWFSGSSTSAPQTSRLHSFSDGLIIVGPRSMNNLIPTFSDDAIELRTIDGLTKVSIKTDGSQVTIQVGPLLTFVLNQDGTVQITNPTGELLSVLFNLLSAIPSGTVLGVPLVLPPTYATDLVKLGTFV